MTFLYFKSTFETHDIAALKIGQHVGEVTGRSVMPNSHHPPDTTKQFSVSCLAWRCELGIMPH